MCELHVEWPTNEITLYVELEVEPIAIEEPIIEPDQLVAVDQSWATNDEDDDTDYKEVTNIVRSSVVDQNDISAEPVESLRDDSVGGAVHVDDHATYGQTVSSDQAVHMDELDWLDEGYEGLEYPNDIFGAQNNEVPNMREHERDNENVNEGDGVRETITDNGKSPKVVASDQATASDQASDNND